MNKSIGFLIASLICLAMYPLPLFAEAIEPPSGSPAPTSTSSGGTRVSHACFSSSLPERPQTLVAIAPHQTVGFTQTDRPTFFIYLSNNAAKSVELSLFNEQKQGLYQTILPIQQQSGLVALSLPKDAPKLIKRQNYYWTIAVVCNDNDRTEDRIMSGWIQYRDFSENLSNLLPLERVALYAKQGFWYDAILEWSALHQKQPQHPAIRKAWTDLIQAIDLSASVTP